MTKGKIVNKQTGLEIPGNTTYETQEGVYFTPDGSGQEFWFMHRDWDFTVS